MATTTTTKEQRTRIAILMLALENAGADSFLVNVIQNWHGTPCRKLQGLLNLLNAGHEARVAQFDIDRLIVDGEEAAWSVLDEWAKGGIGPKHAAATAAEYHPDCPACLRGRPHSQAEHDAKLHRVYAASRGDYGDYQGVDGDYRIPARISATDLTLR